MKKLHVVLVHRSWAAPQKRRRRIAKQWTQPDSSFQHALKKQLVARYDIMFDTFRWGGFTRRSEAVTALERHLQELDPSRKCLVIAHRHGGNIATDAVRNLLTKAPAVEIVGIVCLNTPFFKHELRSLNPYFLVWAIIGALLTTGYYFRDNISLTAVSGVLPIPMNVMFWASLSITISLALLFVVSKVLALSSDHSEPDWNIRPNVLCLSCPDDEKITLLGLGEGISNLPQLFLHPLALVVMTLGAGSWLYLLSRYYSHHWKDWTWVLNPVGQLFCVWVGLSLICGFLGAVAVTILFGFAKRRIFVTFVSRLLVSYMPLLPARAHFRGISVEIKNPLRSFRSAIFTSSDTFDSIEQWLDGAD